MNKTLNTNLSNLAHYNPGEANGVATLDGDGKIPVSQIPAYIMGAMNYQGTWDASTNIPAITSSVGEKGHYYTVSTGGSTNIDGIDVWYVGDVIVFNGTTWDRLDGSAGEVLSVNGLTGAVVLGTMSSQNSNGVSITGGTINGISVTSFGTNTTGNKYVSGGGPSGGAHGDMWYRI
jgi:hypothetical protein